MIRIEDLWAGGIRGTDVNKLGWGGDDGTILPRASVGDDVQFWRYEGDGPQRPVCIVLYFFEQVANITGGGEAANGEATTWSVVLQMKSTSIGTELVHNHVTDIAIIAL